MTFSLEALGRPLAIAHRAGNDLAHLRLAEAAGADLVEADVWSYRGRLELRHLKTLGRLPLLWDRWKLAPAWTPRLQLAALLQAAKPDTGLMLDLKGRDPCLPEQLREVFRAHGGGRPIVVCSRNWALLAPFRDTPEAVVLHSVGSAEQLAALPRELTWHDHHAVSIHRRLLTADVVNMLKAHARTIVAWPVDDEATLARLLDIGVDGVTTDSIDLLRAIAGMKRREQTGAAGAT